MAEVGKLTASVMRCTYDGDDNAGATNNPMKDHSCYEGAFPDGYVEGLTVNLTTKNMRSMFDFEDQLYHPTNEIFGHRKNGKALSTTKSIITTKIGRKMPKKAIVGWDLLVEWKDRSID